MTTPAFESIWAVGDLQGCNASLQALLRHPDIQNSQPHFWFCGDLVNRGPHSKDTLDTIMKLGDQATCVLGNHDLHLLGIAAGVRQAGKSDTLKDILDSPQANTYIDWLRHQPLAHFEYEHLMVHAGVFPAWSMQKTLTLAKEVEHALQSKHWKYYLEKLFGNKPKHWDDTLDGRKRLRFIVNALTRMRMCKPNGNLDFDHKGPPETTENSLPWFEVNPRAASSHTIIFGHWSALGLLLRPNLIGLDTGCVWGRQLTAVRLYNRQTISIDCKKL